MRPNNSLKRDRNSCRVHCMSAYGRPQCPRHVGASAERSGPLARSHPRRHKFFVMS